MNLDEVLNHRRSVRLFDREKPLDAEKVKHCLQLAALAPNSSNMQLWEFYHITQTPLLAKLSKACLDQTATASAAQLVIFVSRQDLHKKRARSVLDFEKRNIRQNSPPERQEKRIKDKALYYGKLMPLLYFRFYGIVGLIRVLVAQTIGFFRASIRQVSESDVRVMVHKSCALAAQTFMIAMANEGYDSCPLEGFDSKQVKKILKLPYGAEITLIVACGIRKGNEGIRGERFRLPFEEIYHSI